MRLLDRPLISRAFLSPVAWRNVLDPRHPRHPNGILVLWWIWNDHRRVRLRLVDLSQTPSGTSDTPGSRPLFSP